MQSHLCWTEGRSNLPSKSQNLEGSIDVQVRIKFAGINAVPSHVTKLARGHGLMTGRTSVSTTSPGPAIAANESE